METLKERIEILKKEYGITPKELSNTLLMSYDAFRMAVKRGIMTDLKLEKIEQVFGISSNWLKTGQGEIQTTSLQASTITGDTVRSFRKRLGLSQTEFSKRIGVSMRAIQEWERKGPEAIPVLSQSAVEKLMNQHSTESPPSLGSLKSRFDRVKKELGTTYKEAGQYIGLSEAAFGMALKRESLNELQFNEIENKLGISKEWLKAGNGQMFQEENSEDTETSIEFMILDKLDKNGSISANEVAVLRSKIKQGEVIEKAYFELLKRKQQR